MYLLRAAASPAGRSSEFLYRPAAAIPPGAQRGVGGPWRPRPVRYNGRAALAGQARRASSPATCLLSNLLANCRRGDGSCSSRAPKRLSSFHSRRGAATGRRAGFRCQNPRESGRMRRSDARTRGSRGSAPTRLPARQPCMGGRRRGKARGAGDRRSWCMRNASPGEPCTWHPLCKCVFTDDGREERTATRAREPPRAPSHWHAHTTHGPTP